MGLWDFVKDAGKSVFGEAQASEPGKTDSQEKQAGSSPAPKASPEADKSGQDSATTQKINALNAEVKALGLDSGDVKLYLTDDTVKIVSRGADRATMEKLILAVGNIKGIAKVEADLPEEANAASGASPVFYEVQKGDTLSGIASDQLGDANRYREIFEANKPMLSDPDKIYPGQKLRIPQK